MKNILISLAVAVVVFFVLSFSGAGNLLGGAGIGPTHYQDENFLQGLHAGTSGQLIVSNAGLLTTSGGVTNTGAFTQSGAVALTSTLTVGSGGTAVNLYKCYSSTTFDPGSVSSSTAAVSVSFLTPSVSAGDILVPSLATTTSSGLWALFANVSAGSGSATASTTLYLYGIDGAAVNLATTTAKVCVIN